MKKAGATPDGRFAETFATLKKLLMKHGKSLTVLQDGPGVYNTACAGHVYRGKPLWFAGIRVGKAYVSYHLLPIYMNAKLQAVVPPELRKRKQGMACFNFKEVDPALFKQLDVLTCHALEAFTKKQGEHYAWEIPHIKKKAQARKKPA